MKRIDFEEWSVRPVTKLLLKAYKQQEKQFQEELHLIAESQFKDDTIHKLLLAQGKLRGAQSLIEMMEEGEFIIDE